MEAVFVYMAEKIHELNEFLLLYWYYFSIHENVPNGLIH